ncbi:MAG: DMT family transporter, partial [Lachnospiraceae bacterium]|nr:DMT family transporter [Lachnospiraceae bacterium]
MNKQTIKSSFLLFLAAVIWGAAFVAQSVGMEYMGPLTFNASRFIIGGIVLLPFVFVQERKTIQNMKTKEVRRAHIKVTVIGGLCCGISICIASTFQQFGMLHTSVGKAGFITALYIVLVPIFGLFFKKKPSKMVWLCAVLAVVGLYLLCINETLTLN